MDLFWTIVRLILAVIAGVVLFVTELFVTGPGGTTIDRTGAAVDAVALIVLVAIIWSLWRGGATLG